MQVMLQITMNQTKYSPMHEHAIDDAKCMSLCPLCKGKTNVKVCIHAIHKEILTPTRIRRQNSIQIKEFMSTSSRIRIYIEFACNFSIQFQEKLKVKNNLK